MMESTRCFNVSIFDVFFDIYSRCVDWIDICLDEVMVEPNH